ncbi:BF3164 family lipoprotein [Odoribacter splanchnicus]|jgi:hypothetical protein|uniref:BF3164 family lipoprotein n=1 Tax=Odoribacter splanchnicus TaxID=28118 RepID=A0AAW6FPS7_9BACT|nr:BF3164 family lipoprotein [Odoribacter splanchnicus]MDB9205783.1 BF3164 family lipoprotein [Odoribacter splanchnicus]MDB9213312.1 BF3164 family lipoprotein [Odoribacter splanchnicus]MDB9224809.1 BF3164 family lipoprotein [Odoribacter splanchnicus]
MKCIFIFYIIFCIGACRSGIKTEELKLLSSSHIKGEKIPVPERCYEDGILIDSILILKESCSENLFYAYNIYTNEKIHQWGRLGRGPEEFNYPMFVNTLNQDMLTIYDSPAANLIQIPLKNTDQKKYLQSQVKKSLGSYMLFLYNFHLTDSLYIFTPIEADEGLFSIYNRKTEKVFHVPYKPDYEYNKEERKDVYYHHLSVSPKHETILAAFQYLNLINFYSFDGELKKSYTLSYSPEENNYSLYITEETILQSIQTYSTNEKVYILWNGNPMKTEFVGTSKILVFSWQGDLEKVYELNNCPRFITIDEHSGNAFGAVFSEKTEMMEIQKYILN